MLDRSKKPVPQNNIDFSLPNESRFHLDNGLEVILTKRNDLPIVQTNFLFFAGSAFDPTGKAGLANLTAMCLDEGAGDYSALELDDKFESLGSYISVTANQDAIFLSMVSLEENFKDSFDLVKEIIENPTFNEEDFEREKQKSLTRLLQLKDRPSYIATKSLESIVFKNSQYGHQVYGNIESVQKISNEDVKQFYSENIGPANGKLIIVGNFEEEILKAELNRIFSNWNHQIEEKHFKLNLPETENKIYFVSKKDAPQSEIRIGHACGNKKDEEFYARNIMNVILGGQFSSRLNSNLREDKGYTYGINSAFNYNRYNGYFTIATSVDTENTTNAISEILKEIDGLKKSISEKEVDFAKSYIIRRFPSMFETFAHMARNITSQILYDLPDNYFDEYIKRIQNVSLSEVEAQAEKSIDKNSLTIVIVGNEKIKAELKEKLNKELIEIKD